MTIKWLSCQDEPLYTHQNAANQQKKLFQKWTSVCSFERTNLQLRFHKEIVHKKITDLILFI